MEAPDSVIKRDCEMMGELAKKRRDIIKKELQKMREREENLVLRQKARKKEMKRYIMEKMHHEKLEKVISHVEDSSDKKQLTRRFNTNKTQPQMESFHDRTHSDKDWRLQTSSSSKDSDIVQLLENFFNNDHPPFAYLPEHIRHELTAAEINDLLMVFNIFDVKSKGYITADDLLKAVKLLGFATEHGFEDIINDAKKDKRGRVTFKKYLEVVLKLQNDGADLFGEIVQFYSLLDTAGKGHITFTDMRNVADELKVGLSSRAIREMIEEADSNGDNRISLQELIHIFSMQEFKSCPGLPFSCRMI